MMASIAASIAPATGIDDQLNRADRVAGRKITCPVLVLSGDQYRSTGENQAEEKPQETPAALVPFLL